MAPSVRASTASRRQHRGGYAANWWGCIVAEVACDGQLGRWRIGKIDRPEPGAVRSCVAWGRCPSSLRERRRGVPSDCVGDVWAQRGRRRWSRRLLPRSTATSRAGSLRRPPCSSVQLSAWRPVSHSHRTTISKLTLHRPSGDGGRILWLAATRFSACSLWVPTLPGYLPNIDTRSEQDACSSPSTTTSPAPSNGGSSAPSSSSGHSSVEAFKGGSKR